MLFWGWDPMVGPYGNLWWDSESRLDQGQREQGFYFSTFGLQSHQNKIRFSAGLHLSDFLKQASKQASRFSAGVVLHAFLGVGPYGGTVWDPLVGLRKSHGGTLWWDQKVA